MGKINVEGLGIVEIGGAVPTPEEADIILRASQPRPSAGGFQETPFGELKAGPGEEGPFGVVPPEVRGAVRAAVQGLPDIFRTAIEMAPGSVGTVGGAVLGTAALGPGVGTGLGAVAGGGTGEAVGQELGLTPRDDTNIKLAAAGAGAGPVVGKGVQLVRRGGGALFNRLPSAKKARAIIGEEEAFEAVDSIGSRILQKQKGMVARTADDLFKAARKAGATVTSADMKGTVKALDLMAGELERFSSFPEAKQSLQLIERVRESLTVDDIIDLDDVVRVRQMVGAAVKRFATTGGPKLGSAKKVFGALSDDLDTIAKSERLSSRAAKVFKAATRRAKLELSVRDLERGVTQFSKPAGGDAVAINIHGLRRWLFQRTSPKGRQFDKNFADALKDELPEINKTISALEKAGKVGKGAGTIVAQGIAAKGGRSLIGGAIGTLTGGIAGGDPITAAVGGLLGAQFPETLTAMLLSPRGRKLLEGATKFGKGQINAKTWAAISEAATQLALPRNDKPENER